MTPYLLECHLPYAMALGVAGAWEEKFEALAPDEVKASCHPRWRRDSEGHSGYRGMTSSIGGALTSTVSSAATAPSSSGSSSSGGGGGGW